MELEFCPLFTTITGETGTGKSIILDAIDFCFCKFSSKNIKKNKDQDTVVSVSFNSKEKLEITKTIDKNNKTTITINGKTASSKAVKELYKDLIDITSQFNSILDKSSHLEVLDKFMMAETPSVLKKLECVSKLSSEIHDTNKKISEIEENIRIIKRDKEYYSQIVDELEQANIKENEETELLEKRANISKLYACNTSIKLSIETLQSLPIESKFNQVIKILEKTDNKSIIEIKNRLESISLEVSDIMQEFLTLKNELFASEEELLEIDDRLSIIRGLSRKYNVSPTVLFEFLNSAKEKTNLAHELDSTLNTLLSHRDNILKEFKSISKEISHVRKLAAINLSKQVCDRLTKLLMPNAIFKIETFYNELKISNSGQDEIEFLANFNEQSSLMPLTQIASGGEAARLHFAIKTIIGTFNNVKTIIFDEVDIGIGGAAAYAMGCEMRNLSETGCIQVISITHSPQVAARANTHVVIRKEISNNDIKISAHSLKPEERPQEIARMISGSTITEDAISAAKQLLY